MACDGVHDDGVWRRLCVCLVFTEAVAVSIAPFYPLGAFGDEMGLIVAFIIGIAFGFFLEKLHVRFG